MIYQSWKIYVSSNSNSLLTKWMVFLFPRTIKLFSVSLELNLQWCDLWPALYDLLHFTVQLERSLEDGQRHYSIDAGFLLLSAVSFRALGLLKQRGPEWSSAVRVRYGVQGKWFLQITQRFKDNNTTDSSFTYWFFRGFTKHAGVSHDPEPPQRFWPGPDVQYNSGTWTSLFPFYQPKPQGQIYCLISANVLFGSTGSKRFLHLILVLVPTSCFFVCNVMHIIWFMITDMTTLFPPTDSP